MHARAYHGSLDGERPFFALRRQSLEKLVVTTRADFKQKARHAGRACAHEFVTDEGVGVSVIRVQVQEEARADSDAPKFERGILGGGIQIADQIKAERNRCR